MPITVECETCGTRFAAKDSLAGKQVKCPSCTGPIRIPAAKGAAPTSQASAPAGQVAGQIAGKCAKCGHPFRVKAEFAGKQGKCKGCGQVMTIPKPGAGKKSGKKPAGSQPAAPTEPAADPFGGLDDLLAAANDPFADLPAADPQSPGMPAGGAGGAAPFPGGTLPAAGNVGGFQPAQPGMPGGAAGGFQPAGPALGMPGGLPGAAPAKKKQANLMPWIAIGGGVAALAVLVVVVLVLFAGGPEEYAGGSNTNGTGDTSGGDGTVAADGVEPPGPNPPGPAPPGGDATEREKLMNEVVGLLAEVEGQVKGSQSSGNADQAIAKIKAVTPRLVDAQERLKAAGRPADGEREQLRARFQRARDQLEATLKRNLQANESTGRKVNEAVIRAMADAGVVIEGSSIWSHDAGIQVAFSGDGKLMVTAGGGEESEQILWDTATGSILHEWTDNHASQAIDFTSDGAALVSAGTVGDDRQRGELCVWNLPACDLRLKASFKGTPSLDDGLAISADNCKAYVDTIDAYYVIELDGGETRELDDVDIDFLARRTAFAVTQDPRTGLHVYASPEELERDGEPLVSFPSVPRISRGACSRNGRFLAGTCHERADTILVVYDLQSKLQIVNQPFPLKSEESVHQVFVTCDGRYVFIHPIAGSTAYFFNVETNERTQVEYERFKHQTLCFTPGNVLLALSGSRFEFFEPPTGNELTPPLEAEHFFATSGIVKPAAPPQSPGDAERIWTADVGMKLAFSTDGKQLVSVRHESGVKHTVMHWDTATGKKRNEWTFENDASGAAISDDGKLFMVVGLAGKSASAIVWDLTTGHRKLNISVEPTLFKSVHIAPDNSHAYIVTLDAVLAMDLADGSLEKIYEAEFVIRCFALSPKTGYAINSSEELLEVFKSPEDLRRRPMAAVQSILEPRQLECSGNGRFVAALYAKSGTRMLAVYDLQSRRVVMNQPSGLPAQDGVYSFAVSHDGGYVVVSHLTSNTDRATYLFDVAAGKRTQVSALADYRDSPLAFTPAGILITSGSGGELQFYDPRTSSLLEPPLNANHFQLESGGAANQTGPTQPTPPAAGDALWAHAAGEVLAFSPDGKQAVSVHPASNFLSRTLILWDTATGAKRGEWTHKNNFKALDFTGDGKALVGVGGALGEPQAVVWDLPEGKERYAVPIDATSLEGVAVSPDNSKAYISDLGGLFVMDLADGASRKLTKDDFFGSLTIAPRTCLAMAPDLVDGFKIYATPEDLGAGRKPRWTIDESFGERAVSGNGRYLAATFLDFDGTRGSAKLNVYDLQLQKLVMSVPSGLTPDDIGYALLVAFDGSHVLVSKEPDPDAETAAGKKSLRMLFDVAAKKGAAFDALVGQEPVAFTPAGILITKTDDKYRFYDPKTKQELQPPLGASHFEAKQ